MTTTNSMNFLIQRNDDRINAAIPSEMRKLIKEVSSRKNMNESNYIKLALQNQLINDLAETA
jgi:predicted DNA binding CopG/RHH family protein